MSHKFAVPPLGPFGSGNTVIVDVNSASNQEDGSWANPYKTIQAAVDACPTPVDAADDLRPWTIVVMSGFYPENVTITSSRMFHIHCMGYVLLAGTDFSARNLTFNALTPSFLANGQTGIYITATVRMYVLGALTITAPTGLEFAVQLNRVSLGSLDGTGVASGSTGTIEMRNGDLDGALNASEMDLEMYDTRSSGAITVKRASVLMSCDLNSSLTCTGMGGGSSPIAHTSFDGNVVIGTDGVLNGMTSCYFAGTVTCAAGFDGVVNGCRFVGLLSSNDFQEAVGCTFDGGISLATMTGSGFFSCYIGGTFTGPAGSFKVDAVTYGRNVPTLAGGATTTLVHDEAGGGGGTGGGGYSVVSVPLSFATPLGPGFSTGVGAPSGGQVGDVYRNTLDDSLYYQTSVGWQGPVASPGSPVTFGYYAPQSYDGVDGDYWVDYVNLDQYGPKAAGAWPAPTPIHTWSLLALAGAPTGTDGVEGDWAWSAPDAFTIRVYGPKESTGWPTDYLDVTVSDSSTATVGFQIGASSGAGGNEVYIWPGSGEVLSNFYTYYAPNGGYTTKRKKVVDPSVVIDPNLLILGGELVTSSLSVWSSNYPVVGATIGGVEVPLGSDTMSGSGSIYGLYAEAAGSVSKNTLTSSGTGGALEILIRAGSGSPTMNVNEILSFDAVLNIYTLPPA